jgi:hypothetical protein
MTAVQCRGALLARGLDASFHLFAASATEIYKLSGTGWTTVTRAAGSYTGPPTGENWSTEQFGDEVHFVNANDAPQVYTLASSSVFAALGGSPPQSRYVNVSGDYLFLLSTTTNPNRLYRSGVNNSAFWTPKQRGSDFQDIPSDGGKIIGMSGVQGAAVVFAQKSIHLYQDQPGSALLFTLKEDEPERSAIAPQSIVSVGGMVFYLAEDGFYKKTIGGPSVPIGAERVDRTFLNTKLDPTYIEDVQGIADPVNKIVAWLYTSVDGTKQIIAYNWQVDRWAPIEDTGATFLIRAATAGYTLGELVTVLGFTTLADVPYPMGSRQLLGGRPTFAAFNADAKLAFFNGGAMEAVLETGELLLADGDRGAMDGFQILGDVSGSYGLVGRTETIGGTLSWTSETAQNSAGYFPIQASGRGLKVRTRIPAETDWHHASGAMVRKVRRAGR